MKLFISCIPSLLALYFTYLGKGFNDCMYFDNTAIIIMILRHHQSMPSIDAKYCRCLLSAITETYINFEVYTDKF